MTFSNDRPRSRRSRVATAIGLCTIALVASLTVAGASQAVTPPTVLLGTAGQFAVLAGSGITNTGVSTISGDVGSSPTHSETGFAACPAADCVTLTGVNHNDPDPNDATTSGAKAALTTAYDDAAGRSPTTVLTELAGQTLVAGVYNSADGNFGMSGTLTLDGENNADAVFIFQTAEITGTLITGGAGNIVLTRGAQACNIFWKVGTSATLGAGSTFSGTILAHTSVSLGDGVTVHGRLLAGEQASGAGAVTLIHDTITAPTTCVTQASINAAAAAAAQAQAQAAAAAQAAAQAQAAAAAAAAAAQAANVQAAAVAAAQAAAAAQVAAQAAAAATAAAEKAAATAVAQKAAAKAAAAKAATAARVAKAAAARAARAKALAKKLAAVKKARGHVGFTG